MVIKFIWKSFLLKRCKGIKGESKAFEFIPNYEYVLNNLNIKTKTHNL
jgi:hypothetical protein